MGWGWGIGMGCLGTILKNYMLLKFYVTDGTYELVCVVGKVSLLNLLICFCGLANAKCTGMMLRAL